MLRYQLLGKLLKYEGKQLSGRMFVYSPTYIRHWVRLLLPKKSKIKLLIIGNNHPLWVAPFPGQIPGLCKRKGNELNSNMNTIILCSQYFTVHAMRQLFEAPTTLPSLE